MKKNVGHREDLSRKNEHIQLEATVIKRTHCRLQKFVTFIILVGITVFSSCTNLHRSAR